MKTSVRKYNEQYRDKMLYIDGYNNAEIVCLRAMNTKDVKYVPFIAM